MERSTLHAVLLGIFIGLVLTGCEQQNSAVNPSGEESRADNAQFVFSNGQVLLEESTTGLAKGGKENTREQVRLLRELLEARRASAQYRDISWAVADGYTDINVVVPHMGFHYMKSSLADGVFDRRHPEILVYNYLPHETRPRLVAVEYAVPLNVSSGPPEGFTGNFDRWERNETFGLWLLHAWVWFPNPSGVFNPTNPLVP